MVGASVGAGRGVGANVGGPVGGSTGASVGATGATVGRVGAATGDFVGAGDTVGRLVGMAKLSTFSTANLPQYCSSSKDSLSACLKAPAVGTVANSATAVREERSFIVVCCFEYELCEKVMNYACANCRVMFTVS
jgi:hypothetical protein